jgi:hypothetical protein
MPHRPLIRIFTLAALISTLWGGVAFACACTGGSGSPSGCITNLPVTVSLHSPFAGSYRGSIKLAVSTNGPPIRNLTGTLYTFSGIPIATGKFRHTIFSTNDLTLKLKKGFPVLQAGSFTLGLFGEPNSNPSCGPKHTFKVIRFLPCLTTLPITFPNLPGGKASDYGSNLTINVASAGFVMRNVNVSLSTFAGDSLGSKHFNVLFGEVTPTFNIPGGLQPGGYTVFVSGVIKDQPASCGPKTAKAVMTFK